MNLRFREVNPAWAVAAIFFVVFLAYANHFRNTFHFDDSHTVTDNPWIRGLHNVPRFFTDGTTFSTLPPNRSYRPIVSTSLAIDYWLAKGLHPAWFHITTFFWYLAQLGLMFPVFRHTLDRARAGPFNIAIALFAVVLYGVHPAMAETVNYIIQRGDVYSTLGAVAGLAIYILAPGRRRYGFYLIPVALGILSKPPAAIFPLLLFFWIWLFDSETVTAALRRTLPAAAVCIAGLVFISRMTPPTFAGGSGSGYFYRITQPWVLLGYFRKFFIPSGFTADTDRVPLPSLLTADALAGLLFLAILIAAIRWCIGRRELRAIAFGLLWFLAASLPTSVFALAEVENDHRMYFPFVGLALATSSAGALLVERMRVPARILAPILALLIAGLAWGTRERNRVWSTEESLWRDVSVKSPRNGRGLMNYGLTLMAKGDYTGALGLFNRALVFTPNYYVLEINLAIAYGAIGDPEKAEQHFTRAISLAPNEASPYFFYGRWVFGLRRTPQAISQLQIATRLNPDYLSAHYLLMQLLADSGDAAGLKTEAQSVLARFPGDAAAASWLDRAAILPPAPPTAETADGYVNQSLNFFHAGKFSDCIDASRKAIKLDPNDAQAWNNMGACYNSLSRWDQGIAAEREAVRLQPGLRLAQNNLAWAREQKRNAGK